MQVSTEKAIAAPVATIASSFSSSSATLAGSTNNNVEDRIEPTRTKYSLYPPLTPKRPSATSGALALAIPLPARASRVVEQMYSAATSSTTTATTRSSPSAATHTTTAADYASPASVSINPAAIPTRTSSSNAVSHNSEHTPSPGSTKKSLRKNRSLGRLAEFDEREWMAQGKHHRLAHSPSSMSDLKNSPPIGQDLINGHNTSWSTEKENILKGPFVYLESHPGKDIRSQMISAFNEWLQVPPASLQVITRVVAMLHTASLLIDDVEDSSQLRRGVPVAHIIFGTAQTINSANYVYFCALKELLTLNNPEVLRIYTEELLNLHRGQGMDLFWRDTLTCPTEDDYLEMVGNKTGGLFRLAIKLMCAESPKQNAAPASTSSTSRPHAPVDYIPLVNTMGLLFQILDDYKNLSDTIYTQNKGLCEDLTEGKFSFPVIHAIRSDPSNLVLINILKQKTQDDDVKKYAVAYMERCGSFSYSRRVLRGLTKKALSLVDEVDGGRGRGEAVKRILERLRVDKHSRASHSA
ncbi:uncharacterized protein MYCFIDRAFT_54584 [Pseudocercospora fijiensis CIRAD86]|uniref:Uncharacterized protein n=1 Tax=Pseudocercospora fijiensis (strain CIRAD86) TaxID=383855 RepID=N1Q8S3_PSEFD|nr:uncharacterized protein MYCFIDRAFT_54584 [Pseudocercospora fijiensis CIRAD86]EME87327.1 hypothetical protein MYCFIDRAFT_54584 [Pseudocercospora fijiensis CIRAD86]